MKNSTFQITACGLFTSALSIMLPLQSFAEPAPGTPLIRRGDEIMVAGRLFHTGTRVVLWTDPHGYDAYRVERRFAPLDKSDWRSTQAETRNISSPNRYNLRRTPEMTDADIERVRGGGWDLPLLQRVVDQFVYHYDVCGTSRQCFKVLQDLRGLSVHFMLDVDGTIYQTLDLKERAWHATTSNSRSVGIEIANMGAYSSEEKSPFAEWYAKDAKGRTKLTIPERFGDGGVLTKHFVGHPRKNEPIVGTVQGRQLTQYDFTPQQYAALAKLTATVCKVLPRIKCDYPRDASGKLVMQKLPDDVLRDYHGLMGHWHIQTNKVDPGPAFDFDYIVKTARRLMRESGIRTSRGNAAMRELFPER